MIQLLLWMNFKKWITLTFTMNHVLCPVPKFKRKSVIFSTSWEELTYLHVSKCWICTQKHLFIQTHLNKESHRSTQKGQLSVRSMLLSVASKARETVNWRCREATVTLTTGLKTDSHSRASRFTLLLSLLSQSSGDPAGKHHLSDDS